MICVYDVGENHYDRLGSCVLTPIKGSHRQIAGGSYELTLEHPIDAGGKWTHLQNGAIIKAPVPEETIEDAREGMAADIYRTVAEAELREEPSEPQQINYSEWNPQASYTVGSRVTCPGWNHRNWQCTFYDQTSPQTYTPPYNNNTWWKQIADYTSGSPVIVKLPAGETLYLVEAEGGWYLMMTPYGVQGYIRADKVEFVKHVEPGEITSHVITEQLFRITEVDIDNEANKVTAKAQHVSYDLNGILCEDMEISQASAAMAISRIAQGLMMDYPGAIATNLTDTAGTYTQSIKGRNGGFCLLDPDRGVLPAFGAMLKRDNWDVFIMKKKHTDRGYRIRYGKNAKGINWQRKVQDLVTRVVPVAKNEDGSNLYLPEKWVDSTHIGDYPTIIMEWLRVDGQVGKDDGTGTDTVWTLENLYTEMRTKAGERFTVDKVDVPAEEVTVNFEQLGDTAEYPWMRERETILLYDKVQAIDERIGLRMDLYVTEIEYDIIRRKVTGVKLSNTDSYRERTVTGFNVQDNSITPRKLTDEVKDSFMASAVGVMPNYANSNTWKPNTASSEGYVQKGEGNANKVWATNGSGEPGWRTPGSYSLPLAADGTRGGVQIGYTQSGKNYPVQLDGEKMYVNVPWKNDTYPYTIDNYVDTNFISNFRQETKGDTNPGSYIANIRANTTGVEAMPLHGAGFACGISDTHMFISTSYNSAAAYIGGGNRGKINWTSRILTSDYAPWSVITDKPDTATRWPSWSEVTGKPEFVRAYGTYTGNIDEDAGQSFKTYDPAPSGTPPTTSPNISVINIGDTYVRRKQFAFPYEVNHIYYRRRDENGWHEWIRLAGAHEAISNITRSGKVFTAIKANTNTFTFDLPDVAGTAASQTDPTIITNGERYKTNWIYDQYRNQLMGLEPSYPYVQSTSFGMAMKRGDYVVVKGGTFSAWNTTNLLVLKSDKAAGATLSATDFESRTTYGDANYFSYFPVNNVRQRMQNLMGQYQRGLAVYCDGNTHPYIDPGFCVFVENHASYAPGFYWTGGDAIAANAPLTGLSYNTGGPINYLKSLSDRRYSSLNTDISTVETRTHGISTGVVGSIANGGSLAYSIEKVFGIVFLRVWGNNVERMVAYPVYSTNQYADWVGTELINYSYNNGSSNVTFSHANGSQKITINNATGTTVYVRVLVLNVQ